MLGEPSLLSITEPAWHNWILNHEQPTPALKVLTPPCTTAGHRAVTNALWLRVKLQWYRYQTGANPSAQTALWFHSMEIEKQRWGNSSNHTTLWVRPGNKCGAEYLLPTSPQICPTTSSGTRSTLCLACPDLVAQHAGYIKSHMAATGKEIWGFATGTKTA